MVSNIGRKVHARYRGDSNGVLEEYDEKADVCTLVLNNTKSSKYYISSNRVKELYSFSRPRYKKDY